MSISLLTGSKISYAGLTCFKLLRAVGSEFLKVVDWSDVQSTLSIGNEGQQTEYLFQEFHFL